MDTQVDVDVVIVGYGPGGAVLASILGQRGHRVAALERFPTPYNLPRMSTIHGEVARIMQHAADPGAALAGALPQRVTHMHGADGSLLRTQRVDEMSCGHPRMLSQNQPVIEQAVHDRVDTLDTVQVFWGHSCTRVEDLGNGIVATAVSEAGDAITLRGQYLVGMDGASSMVRETAGIRMEVLDKLDDEWILTDFDIVDSSVPTPEMAGFMTLEHPFYWGPNGDRRCRTDVRMEPSDPPERRTQEAALSFVEEQLGMRQDALRVTRHVNYRFRAEIAERMRAGNIFIGGDAAHLMPPTMAEGAASAMRDAVSLGWRLDLVLRGVVAGALLDDYERERLSNVGPIVQGSLMMITLLGERNAELAAARDAMLSAGDVPPPPESMIAEGLIVTDGDGFPVEPAGFLSPQGRVRIGSAEGLLDDLIGFGFQLVSKVPLDDMLSDEQRRRLEALGVHEVVLGNGDQDVHELDTQYRDFFEARGVVAYLSRPDFYIYGAATDAADIAGLVDSFLAAMPVPDQARADGSRPKTKIRQPGENFEYGTVEAGGYILTYATAGPENSSTIVSLPGSAGIEMSTAKDQLATRFRVIEINPPGWGDQHDIDSPARAVDVAAVISSAVEQLVSGSFFLIGTSMGGPVALYLTERTAERVQGIVLEGSMAPLHPEDLLPLTSVVPPAHPNKPWATPSYVHRQTTNRLRLISRTEPDLTADSAVRAVNDREIPVLALLGENEEVLKQSASDSYAAAIPHVQTAIVSRARHDIQNTNPQEFVRLVQQFIAAVGTDVTEALTGEAP